MCEIKRSESLKFLGVLFKYIENKITKNIGLLFKAKPVLKKNNLFYIYTIHISIATLTMTTWPGEVYT